MGRLLNFYLLLMTCCLLTNARAAVGDWTRTIFYGGDISAVAVHPDHSSVVYAMTRGESWTPYSARFYRSDDSGGTWVSRSEGLSADDRFYLHCMAIDPLDPSTIYIAGMEYLNHGRIYKTTNEGGHWDETSITGYIWGIAINPSDHLVIYLATDVGIYKSTDAGAGWALTGLTVSARSVIVDPAGSAIWAGTLENGVYKSTDEGMSWTSEGLDGQRVWCLLLDEDGSLYAGTESGLYYRPEGSDWEEVLPAKTRALAKAGETDIYAGTDGGGIYKGRAFSWVPSSSGLTCSTIKSLAVDPQESDIVYAGSGLSGVYRSADGGGSWSCRSQGLSPARVHAVVPHPAVPGVVVAATGWGVFKSSDGGESWEPSSYGLIPMDYQLSIGSIAIDPARSLVSYLSYNGSSRVFKTTDGGKNWHLKNNGISSYMMIDSGICVDPQNTRILYVGGSLAFYYCAVYKSLDGGENWAHSETGLPVGDEYGQVHSLAVHPHNPSVLYAGCESGGLSPERRLYKSLDAGLTWSGTSLEKSAYSVRIDPYLPAMIHVWDADSNPDKIWRSTNGGGSWVSLPWNPPAYPIRLGIDGSSFDRLFTSNWTGDATRVYWSIIDGIWWPLGPELPFGGGIVNAASTIAVDPHNANVYVGAYSAGLFSYTRPYSVAIFPEGPLPVTVPAGSILRWNLTLRNLTTGGSDFLLVEAFYNANGNEVYRRTEALFLPPETTMELQRKIPVPSGTPPSVYGLRAVLANPSLTKVYDAAGLGFGVTGSR